MISETFQAKDIGHGRRNSVWVGTCTLAAMSVLVLFPSTATGQTKQSKIQSFWVTGTSSVTVKADRAMVVMEIRSSSPRLDGALCELNRIQNQVTLGFEEQGLAGKFRFTANHYFADGMAVVEPRTFSLRKSPKTYSFEVKQYAIVTFDESDLAKPGFDDRLTGAVDVLLNAGAQLAELPFNVGETRFAGPILFTLKDPQPVVLEAIQQAMDEARRVGQHVAKSSGRRLGPIIDARVNRPMMVELPRQQDLTVFDELSLKYFSTSKDAVTIPAMFAAEYSTK